MRDVPGGTRGTQNHSGVSVNRCHDVYALHSRACRAVAFVCRGLLASIVLIISWEAWHGPALRRRRRSPWSTPRPSSATVPIPRWPRPLRPAIGGVLCLLAKQVAVPCGVRAYAAAGSGRGAGGRRRVARGRDDFAEGRGCAMSPIASLRPSGPRRAVWHLRTARAPKPAAGPSSRDLFSNKSYV